MPKTPCIGICSTTYGDLVCRGCKRFAHEITGWNGYAPEQRAAVWQRLRALQAGATRHFVDVHDPAVLARALDVNMDANDVDASALAAYDWLRRRAQVADSLVNMSEKAGLRLRGKIDGQRADAVLRLIDQEFYARALAHYERSFRTPAR